MHHLHCISLCIALAAAPYAAAQQTSVDVKALCDKKQRTYLAFAERPKRSYNYKKKLVTATTVLNAYAARSMFRLLNENSHVLVNDRPLSEVFICPIALRYFLDEANVKCPSKHPTFFPLPTNFDQIAKEMCALFYGTSYVKHTHRYLSDVMEALKKNEGALNEQIKIAETEFKGMAPIEQLQFVWYLAVEEDRRLQLREQLLIQQFQTIASAIMRCDLRTAYQMWHNEDRSYYDTWRKRTTRFMRTLQESTNEALGS